MADERKHVINLHTSTQNNKPTGKLLLGEIAVEHNSVDTAKLYVETVNGSNTASTIATFITENAIDTKISNAVSGLTNIVDALTDIVITGASGDTIITATVNNPDASANTLTITHKTATTINDSFQKVTTDGYGHVTGGTAVAIGDITGLTGWADAVKGAETKLSTGSTGTGNVVKGITVNDHQITTQMGSISSGDVTDFAQGVVTSETKLSTGSTGSGNAVTNITVSGHQITFEKGKTFSEDGHKHVGDDITGGTVGISYLPTATTVNSSSDDTTVPTSKAVQDAIDGALTSTMDYKGATGTLPSTAKTGDVYIANTAITIPAGSSATGVAQTAETGDYIVARTSGASPTWDVIEKNLDGAVTSTGMTNNQIVVANGANTIISQDPATIWVGSANTVPLSGVTDADDLKAIEALTGTTGVLNKTAANTWELKQVISEYSQYSGITTSGSLIDAKLIKDVIDANELVTAEALNDLNGRAITLSSATNDLDTRVTALENNELPIINTVADFSAVTESGYVVDATVLRQVIVDNELVTAEALNELNGKVNTLSATSTNFENRITTLENATVDLSTVASAITVNETTHVVSNGGVNIGNYLSGSTQYVDTISQTTTASAVTTTFHIANASGTASYDVVEPIIIDCGSY